MSDHEMERHTHTKKVRYDNQLLDSVTLIFNTEKNPSLGMLQLNWDKLKRNFGQKNARNG